MHKFSWGVTCRNGAALGMALVLGACAGGYPDVDRHLVNCERFAGSIEDPSDKAVFFMSLRLNDCRGERMTFANHRYPSRTFGESDLDPAARTPWKNPETRSFGEGDWLVRLQHRIDADTPDRRLLVFIHGFNNNFEIELQRAHVLAELFPEKLPAVVVDWPSDNRVAGYVADATSLSWAQRDVDRLVAQLAGMSPDITIVAHSMGSRATIAALASLDRAQPELAGNVRRVVFASPDVDRDEALRAGGAIENLLKVRSRRILVYASFRDRVLGISRDLSGYARLGSTECKSDLDPEKRKRGRRVNNCHATPVAEPNLAIVETGYVDSKGFLNHADFIDSCPVNEDFRDFVADKPGFELREAIAVPGDDTVRGWWISPEKVKASDRCKR